MTSLMRRILITAVRSGPYLYFLKMNLAKNKSGVVLRGMDIH